MSNGDTIRMIARDESRRVIQEHLVLCPLNQLGIEARLRGLEISYAKLTGLMIGSGLLSASAVYFLPKAFGG